MLTRYFQYYASMLLLFTFYAVHIPVALFTNVV